MLVVPAAAKINLALEVVRRRDDGWHDIESVVVPIDWHDLIGLDAGEHAGELRVTGPASDGVPGAAGTHDAAGNLAVRAVDVLVAATTDEGAARAAHARFSVWLHKRVPARAGLGGGSADAAAVLRAATRLLHEHGTAVGGAAVSAAAAALGSDVPALLARAPVHVTGRGEHLAEIQAPSLDLVVAFLGPSSTGDAYRALRQEEMTDGSRVRMLIAALTRRAAEGDDEPAGGSPPSDDLLGSALEAPALRLSEQLAAAAHRLREQTSPLRWHMTGSGGAFFAMTPTTDAAEVLAQRLRAAGLAARACRTLPSSLLEP
jgi:4-diphosphocytidyl-2-C-methyl-D-erythritol kinase